MKQNKRIDDLPEDTREEIRKVLNTNSTYHNLVLKNMELVKAGQFAKASVVRRKILRVEEEVVREFMRQQVVEAVEVNSMTANFSEKDNEEFMTLSHGMVLVADLLEVLSSDINQLLHKYNPDDTIIMFNRAVALGKECKKLVEFMEHTTMPEYHVLFADEADRLHEIAWKRFCVFKRKVDKAYTKQQKELEQKKKKNDQQLSNGV